MAEAAVSGNATQQGHLPAEPEIEIIEEGTQQAQAPHKESAQNGQGYEYPDDDEQGGDSRTGAVSGAGEGGQADDNVAGGQTAEQLSARQRRRQRERNARNAERAELIQLRRQVADLHGRFEAQDARLANNEVAGIDGQISGVETEIQRATTIMSRAMAAQNGEDFAKALQIRDALRDQLVGLRSQKQTFDQGGQGQGQGQDQGNGQRAAAPGTVTPQQLHFARIFASRHPWYKHGSGDPDTQQVVQIDNEMTAQGLNPQTSDYWVEFERRVREDMPHKFQQASNDSGQQGQNNGGGNGQRAASGNRAGGPKLPGAGNAGGSGAASGGPIKFLLSPARKKALVDLGVWDDPVQRTKHIRRMVEWDKANQPK